MNNSANTSANRSSFAEFSELHEHTVQALQKEGFTAPFAVQSEVIPYAASGADVLVKSPTGSGKTLAFGLSIIAQLQRGQKRVGAVILVPGRELAIQVRDELVPLAWSLQQRCVAVYGGGSQAKQRRQLQTAAIVIATPGRLIDLLEQNAVDLSVAQTLVLDEADRMLDMGFTKQVERVAASMPQRSQTMMFSATLEGRVGEVAERLTKNARRIEPTQLEQQQGEITHRLVATSTNHKRDALVDLLKTERRDLAIVFVRTQAGAINLTDFLLDTGFRATTVHGGIMQSERIHNTKLFADGQCDVLVATDVFARGIDVSRVTHVFNYELPEDADAYTHRIGRTARAGRSGSAITFFTQKQRPSLAALLDDLQLPAELLNEAVLGSTTRVEPVANKRRFQQPEMTGKKREIADRQRARAAGTRAAGKRAVGKHATGKRNASEHVASTYDTGDTVFAEGNGRGAPLKRKAPMRGAAPGSEGRGKITGYDRRKGFGFIKQNAGGKDVFFHRRVVLGAAETDHALRPGASVTFTLDRKTGDKLRASRVEVSAPNSPSHKSRVERSRRR